MLLPRLHVWLDLTSVSPAVVHSAVVKDEDVEVVGISKNKDAGAQILHG